MRSYEITRPNSCTATRESPSFATGIHPDRTVGRYRHHCDPRGNASARVIESQAKAQGTCLSNMKQPGFGDTRMTLMIASSQSRAGRDAE
jgi:hypothetical protein